MREGPKLSVLPARGEPDPAVVRIAQYTGYPRVSKDQRPRTAIARRHTSSALSLVALEREEIGALLRLRVNDLCGPPTREMLARVVSCSERDDGRFELRVEAVEPYRARFVRRSREAMRLEG